MLKTLRGFHWSILSVWLSWPWQWVTPLFIDGDQDSELLTTTLWIWSSNYFLISLTVHLSDLSLSNLLRKILWRKVSKTTEIQITCICNPSLVHWCNHSIVECFFIGNEGWISNERSNAVLIIQTQLIISLFHICV